MCKTDVVYRYTMRRSYANFNRDLVIRMHGALLQTGLIATTFRRPKKDPCVVVVMLFAVITASACLGCATRYIIAPG